MQAPPDIYAILENPSGDVSVVRPSDESVSESEPTDCPTTVEMPIGNPATVEKPCSDHVEKPAELVVIPCTCCFKEAAQVLCLECVVGLCSECTEDHEKSHKVLSVKEAAVEAKRATKDLHGKLKVLLDEDEAQTKAEAAIDEQLDSSLTDLLTGLDRRRADGNGRVRIELKALLRRTSDLDSRLAAIEAPSTLQSLLAHRVVTARLEAQLHDALKMQEKRTASRRSSDQLLFSFIADRFGEKLFSMMNETIVLFSRGYELLNINRCFF